MKKLLGFIFIVFFGITTSTFAAPFTYTFSGTISHILDDAGAAAVAGISVGDSVSYTFLIDRARDPIEMYYDGSLNPNLIDSPPSRDYFYVDLLSGSLIDEVNGGSFDSAGDIAVYKEGLELDSPAGQGVIFLTGSDDNFIRLEGGLDLWTIGSIVNVEETAFDENVFYTTVTSQNLTLTNISAVPVPAAVWLFGTGLLGIFGFNYRKNKA
ncbi:MAG: hypothetical protein B6D72_09420 [gamma proteobacterium symbiont of Ctena orbiculata]|uniref:Ice-binding protein C-terminal domain-containing protein n=1 Tax=Candidatus Thiodiazotropha taylori TaxID=2792791 RepID=A0A944QTR7_9GAMM|nr:hypothetical protein [Candidatus Thiodiazotropha taylori]PUB85120.1 MAG: hypothetical protein DBP00_13480 [gamma proteobacterium symbiont of Ctena orbiculata]MBT2989372.1 hypothetical protein [Candidatus Thiodiazotropha taylori]MBT2996952.1 hypothetical protein [Candidatus Thiodiazotropha taylori]MBT3000807.1 hypothetical protein [Candidatus Thiodiazotropha taylori]